MNDNRGVALVQVLVMSLVLLIFAVGVLQIVFGTHFLFARVKSSEEGRAWVESCMAQKNQNWQGNPCAGASSDQCDFSAQKGPVVTINCASPTKTEPAKVSYTVTWQ